MNVYNSTRTIYNLKLQTCMMFGLPYHPLPNTTLNEKFNIYPYNEIDCNYENQNYPRVNGIVIGIGGNEVVNSDILDLKLGKHSPVDAALFEHIPFVIRPIENDLTIEMKFVWNDGKVIKNIKLKKT